MMDLPGSLGQGIIQVWRLDHIKHQSSWDSGQGSFLVGGRWNSKGIRAVYCALNPSTAILEVAAHKGFKALNANPYVLTRATISRPTSITVIHPAMVPNPHWLNPTSVSSAQQRYGDELLQQHAIVAIPSTISRQAWNLIFLANKVNALITDIHQERFALDPRLDPVP